jgi:tripartite-type tricarboxylate transporter receptor subunit TctC
MSDMLGNQITAGIASVPDFIENHKAGKIRVVAVLGKNRQAALPDVPTFHELGLVGLEDTPYYGLFAPAGTSREVIDRFSQALGKVIADPQIHDRLTRMGLSVGLMTSEQLTQRERAYSKVWAKLIKDSGFVPQ